MLPVKRYPTVEVFVEVFVAVVWRFAVFAVALAFCGAFFYATVKLVKWAWVH